MSGLGHPQAWSDGGRGRFRGVSAWFLAQSAQKVLEVPTRGCSLGLGSVEGHLSYTGGYYMPDLTWL